MTATTLEVGEDDDLPVYCVSGGVQQTFSVKEKDYEYNSSLIGRYWMDSEIKFTEFFRISRDFSSLLIFHLIPIYT
jgi:hypothetical protein